MSRAKWRKRLPTVFVDFETYSTADKAPALERLILIQPPGVPWHLYEFQARTLSELYVATGVDDVTKLDPTRYRK